MFLFGTLRAFPQRMKTPLLSRICILAACIIATGAAPRPAHAQAEGIPVAILNAEIRAYKASFGAEKTTPDREWHPRAALIRPRINSFTLMSAGVYTASFLDMTETHSSLPNFHERDPLARPLLLLPTPLYYASGVLLATGVNYLGLRMRESRFHKVWWLPQVISMAANLGGYAYTKENTFSTPSTAHRGGRR
jgi:hypothetical protein